MATLETRLVKKNLRHRGLYSGKHQSVTGVLPITAGQSIATTDLIRAVPLGENIRPVRLILQFVPTSGTPVLTNATFNVGVASISTTAFVDSRGVSYPALTTDADQLSAAAAIDADGMLTDIEIPRPVADSVSNYAPFYVTLTPAGAGAFSVAGGTGDLKVTVEFEGREYSTGQVYDEYVNQKYKN